MANHQISAILPCYNHQAYLSQRIKSVLCQTFPVSEIIFLDDASTDLSFQLAQSLLIGCSVEVTFHKNNVNSGSPFSQWNKGVLLAKHPLIWIAETDDSCQPDFLETLYSALTSTNSILAYSQSRYINSNNIDQGSPIAFIPPDKACSFLNDFAIEGCSFIRSFMTARNSIPNTSSVIFFRSAFIDAGLANTSMRFCGDWDMWIRMAHRGRVAFVAKDLNLFRCHSTTTRANGNLPAIQAESLACRFKAQLACKPNESQSITFQWILKALFKLDRSNIIITIKSLRLSSILHTYKFYSRINGAPHICISGWVAIVIWVSYNTISSLATRHTITSRQL